MTTAIKELTRAWKAANTELERLAEEMCWIENQACMLPIESEEDAQDHLDFLIAIGRIDSPEEPEIGSPSLRKLGISPVDMSGCKIIPEVPTLRAMPQRSNQRTEKRMFMVACWACLLVGIAIPSPIKAWFGSDATAVTSHIGGCNGDVLQSFNLAELK